MQPQASIELIAIGLGPGSGEQWGLTPQEGPDPAFIFR
ncbi:hypothetical protein BH24PSE2_BH24PSE2_04010 [soil metagenome]